MASETTQKPKEITFCGGQEPLAELESDSEPEDLTESDSSESYDSVEEPSFLEGEDSFLDRKDSGSDEEWVSPVKTKKRRLSLTLRSSTPTGSKPTTPIVSTPDLQLTGHSTTSPTVTKKKARGRLDFTSDVPVCSQETRSPVGASARVLEPNEDMWHDITDIDEKPNFPKFLPKRQPGPQLILSYSPLQLFQLFFSTSVVQTIVQNTNKFAEKSAAAGKKMKWKPVSVNEFYSYISLIIFMGLVKAKRLTDYWSQSLIYKFPYPASVMTSKRFLAISSNLHLSDEDEENTTKKGTKEYDRLFKIKPLYLDILSACRSFFHPKRELSIDERMVASKARNGMKQYMKAKPTKWGYKLFVLADSETGYTWNFFVYEGKNTHSSGKGLSYDSVKTLLDYSVLGSGYMVFMDNFYTSPTLLADLLRENTLACGTIRSHWQGFPKTTINDLPKRAKRGTIRWCRKEELLYVKWMDTKAVAVCSTMHKAYEGDTVQRRVKDEQGVWNIVNVPVPAAIKDYNKYMGGVDLSDALISYYNVLHKSKKWYKTFFFHFIDIAIVNSFILHQQMAKINKETSLTHKVFREKLLLELVNISKKPSDVAGPSGQSEQEEPTAGPPAQPAKKEKCIPAFYSADATGGRRKCEMCKKEEGVQVKTPVYCKKCNVPLCLVPKRNCFAKWHEDK
ncbi:piggyBac transposable element-derived protein 4 [Hoplias malabaricus]|uniref:piggyBac transposable element-derived protein 4 n=1 Tax=Hoplias malabaricus TaxID=27720 RepID=UPI00346357EE